MPTGAGLVLKLSSLTRYLLCQASVPAASAMATLSLESSTLSGKAEQNRKHNAILTDTEVLCGCAKGKLLTLPWVNRQIRSSLGRARQQAGLPRGYTCLMAFVGSGALGQDMGSSKTPVTTQEIQRIKPLGGQLRRRYSDMGTWGSSQATLTRAPRRPG